MPITRYVAKIADGSARILRQSWQWTTMAGGLVFLAACSNSANIGTEIVARTNSAPQFTSADSTTASEGQTGFGYTASATDADGDSLTYTIDGGADAVNFSIEATTGVLTFNTAPVFSAPSDADADNIHEVRLAVNDGNGGSDTLDLLVTVVEPQSIVVEMTFPTRFANLGGGTTTTIATGSVTDELGGQLDPAAVTAIDVNGVTATIDTRNATHWRWSVSVPVVEGPNTLTVTYALADATQVSFDNNIDNFALHLGFDDLELDTTNNQLLVIDSFEDVLVRVDLSSGQRSLISGTGTGYIAPTGLTVDAANNRALLVDAGLDALLAVDLATGNRIVLSDDSEGIGTGQGMVGPGDVAYDAPNNRAFVADQQLDAVLAIDLNNGNRTIVSDATTGTGPALANPRDLVFDAPNNRLLLADGTLDAILAVDVASGDRVVLSDPNTGTGTVLGTPENIALDSANNRVLVSDQTRGVFVIDLATGDRTVIHSLSGGYGANGTRLSGIAADLVNGVVYLSDGGVDSIFAVNLATTERTIVSDNSTGSAEDFFIQFLVGGIAYNNDSRRLVISEENLERLWTIDIAGAHASVLASDTVGTGPAIDFLGKLAVDSTSAQVYYIERNRNTLNIANLATGVRTVVSGGGIGTGPDFSGVKDVALDVPRNRAFVVDWTDKALFQVDLSNGDRTLVSDAATGTGPLFTVPDSVVYDSVEDRVLVLDWGSDILFAVDPATGDRTVLSDNLGVGTGPNYSIPFDMEFDLASNRILVTDYGINAVLAVNLATGDRTPVSMTGLGTGPDFLSP